MFQKLGLFVNSTTVLVKSNGIHYDWHEAVVNSAQLAALAVERPSSVQVKADLV